MKITGNWQTREVQIDGKNLSPTKSQKVYNHSPDGFNWSYCGSGPSQLALAILLEYFPKEVALQWYQEFKREVIGALPASNFEINVDLDEWINERVIRP